MDAISVEAARRKIVARMIDGLKDRLPGHTMTQRLTLLRTALDETRHRALAHPEPIETDAATGKPKPAGPREQAFGAVSDVLFDEVAAILAAA